jgi:hypothetical protein
MLTCNECGMPQLEGALFCTECGVNLVEKATSTTFLSTSTMPFKRQSAPALSPRLAEDDITPQSGEKRVIFVIPSSRRRLAMQLTEELYIGRAAPETGALPMLDLTDYGAAHAGVSRRHAVIQLTEAGVILRDLDSTNGTLLNNQLLEPDTPYLLRSGDEVHFGELLVHILFD